VATSVGGLDTRYARHKYLEPTKPWTASSRTRQNTTGVSTTAIFFRSYTMHRLLPAPRLRLDADTLIIGLQE
jgi:hypothetical protein